MAVCAFHKRENILLCLLLSEVEVGIHVTVIGLVVSAVVLGISPAYGGHGPEDLLGSTCIVVLKGKAGVHCRHNGTAEINVGNIGCVDAYVTVTELAYRDLLKALGGKRIKGAHVILGKLRSYVVNGARLKHCDSVCCGNYLVTHLVNVNVVVDLRALGKACFHALLKVRVGLEVNYVVGVEVVAVGIVLALIVGCHVCACTHRNGYVSLGLDNACHVIEGCVVNAETVVRNINLVALCIVVLGCNGEGEVPYRLGVDTVDLDLEHVVLVGIHRSSVGVVVVCYGVGVLSDGNAVNIGGVTERHDTGDVGVEKLAVLHILLQDNLLSLRHIEGLKLLSSCPGGENNVKLAVDLGVVNVLNSLFLAVNGGGVVTAYRQNYRLVCIRLAVLLAELNVNVALHIHEGGDLVKSVGLVGLVGVGFLCRLVVAFKLLFEKLKGLFIVLHELLVGNRACICGNRLLVADAELPSVNSVSHLLLGGGVTAGGSSCGVTEKVNKLGNTAHRLCSGLLGQLLVGVNTAREILLNSVLREALNVCGIHGGGACVYGVEVNVEIEKHVLDRKRLTVREFKSVFDNEGVGRSTLLIGVFALIVNVVDRLVVKNDYCVIRTVGDFSVALFVGVGGKHTDLRHRNYCAVRCAGREERVEKTVQGIRHNNERLVSATSASGKHRHDAEHHRDAQQHGNNFIFHCMPSFFLD